MATKGEAMKIDQIRLAETMLFGIERVSIFLFVFFGGIPRFLYYSVGVFLFSNAYYASLAYERLFVTPRPNEPKSIVFLVERYAIWFTGSYFFMGFPVYRFLAAAVFVMSNMYLITKLFGINMTQMILNYITPGDEKEKEKVKQLAPLPEQEVQLNEKEEKTENNFDQPEVQPEMEVESSTLIKVNIMEEDIVSNKEPQQHEEEKEQRDEEERRDGEQEEEDEDEDFDLNVNIDGGSDDFSVDDNDDDEVSDISDDDDGQGGMRANDDSNEETMPEDGEKNVEVKETESKGDMEYSAAEISEADAITKEMKPSPNDFETHRIEKRNMLITKMDEICLERKKYLEEKVHEWEEERAFLETEYQEQKKELEDKYVELKEENRILRAESTMIEQQNRIVLEYVDKCRRLEEEKAVLNERLDIEKAAVEFFKKCMHNLGLN